MKTTEELARKAGWSGLYIEWAKPTGEANWIPYKRTMTVPVTEDQLEAFRRLVIEDYVAGLVPVGETAIMPGAVGFTAVVFRAEDVPVLTKLYAIEVKK